MSCRGSFDRCSADMAAASGVPQGAASAALPGELRETMFRASLEGAAAQLARLESGKVPAQETGATRCRARNLIRQAVQLAQGDKWGEVYREDGDWKVGVYQVISTPFTGQRPIRIHTIQTFDEESVEWTAWRFENHSDIRRDDEPLPLTGDEKRRIRTLLDTLGKHDNLPGWPKELNLLAGLEKARV